MSFKFCVSGPTVPPSRLLAHVVLCASTRVCAKCNPRAEPPVKRRSLFDYDVGNHDKFEKLYESDIVQRLRVFFGTSQNKVGGGYEIRFASVN